MSYITEAFKQFKLMEAEDFDLTPEGLDNISSFLSTANDIVDETEDVIDLEATEDDELKKSYVGKVICDCNVCHSNIFKNKEDIIFDERGVANIDDECPYCMSTSGYTVVGEIAPYSESEVKNAEDEVKDENDSEEVMEESCKRKLKESISYGTLVRIKPDNRIGRVTKSGLGKYQDINEVETIDGEDLNLPDRTDRYYDSDLEVLFEEADLIDESIENVSIDTEDETMTMTTKEDGGIYVETSPKVDEDEITTTEDEVIAPLSNETAEEIGLSNDSEEDTDEFAQFESDETPDENVEEETTEEETEEVEPEEFDEESFNELGESLLKRKYSNVKSFKTTGVSINENLMNVDGIITFKSGNVKRTNFVFEATTKNEQNKLIFEGFNKQITPENSKSFILTCSLKNDSLICESLEM